MRPERRVRGRGGWGPQGRGLIALVGSLLVLPVPGWATEPTEVAALCSPVALAPSQASGGSADAAGVRTAQRMIDRATADYSAGRYVEAIRELRVAYQIAPVPDLLFNLAQSCRAAGQSEAALALYQRLLQQTLAPPLRTVVEQRERELRQAEAQAQAQALVKTAEQLLIDKQYAQAKSAWERAYERVPEPVYLLRIAQALRQAGRAQEALVGYERFFGVSTDPRLRREATEQVAAVRADALHQEAQARLHAQQPAEAAELWARAYAQYPDPLYLQNEGDAERRAGLVPEAISTYERFLVVAPQSPARATVATQLQELRTRPGPQATTRMQLVPATATAPRPPEARPLWRRPWLWISIGAVVVVTGTVAAVVATQVPIEPSYPNLRTFTFPGGPDAK